jgi:hypothetical protein
LLHSLRSTLLNAEEDFGTASPNEQSGVTQYFRICGSQVRDHNLKEMGDQ